MTYHHEQFWSSTLGWWKMEDYFLTEVWWDTAKNIFTCTESTQKFQCGILPLLKRLAQFWEKKSSFVLKFAWAMQFFKRYIHLCLCTEQPVVLFLEAFSKLTWYYYSHCHPLLCYIAEVFQHFSRSRGRAQERRNSIYMNNIATKCSGSGDARCFNENSRNKKKRIYLGIAGIFLNSSSVFLGIAEKNMKMRWAFYLEGTKPKGIILKIHHYFWIS